MIVRLVALFGLIAAGAAPVASADDLRTAAQKVSDCRAIDDDAARLACLDAAALALSVMLSAPSDEAQAAVQSQAETGPAPAPQPETPAEPEWARAPEPREKPKREVAAVAPAADTAATPEKEKKVPIWARVFQPSEDDDEENVYAVTITRITRNNAGRHFFHTSEGQVWRQTVAGKVRPPKSLPAAAKIEQKLMGSPGLRFVDGPTGEYTVRRIE